MPNQVAGWVSCWLVPASLVQMNSRSNPTTHPSGALSLGRACPFSVDSRGLVGGDTKELVERMRLTCPLEWLTPELVNARYCLVACPHGCVPNGTCMCALRDVAVG